MVLQYLVVVFSLKMVLMSRLLRSHLGETHLGPDAELMDIRLDSLGTTELAS